MHNHFLYNQVLEYVEPGILHMTSNPNLEIILLGFLPFHDLYGAACNPLMGPCSKYDKQRIKLQPLGS